MIEESEWSERRGEKEPAHRVHKRQSPAPSSSPYKSQCLIPLVYHLLLHSPLSVFLFFYPAFFFFWNKWLNLTGHFQEGVPEQSNANTIVLDYVVHGWDSKFKAALSTGVMWKILQIWVTVNRAGFSFYREESFSWQPVQTSHTCSVLLSWTLRFNAITEAYRISGVALEIVCSFSEQIFLGRPLLRRLAAILNVLYLWIISL